MTPWLSIIVPTIGRPTLAQTLQSIRLQAKATDVEILVVGDTHQNDFQPALAVVQGLCADYDALYLGFDGGEHCVGQPQRQAGQAAATGEWLWWLQDDDIATLGALAILRKALRGRPGPRLCRVKTQWGFIVWDSPELLEGHIDADCIVAPNEPAKLGTWGVRYNGDFDFIHETCSYWGKRQVRWVPDVIAIARPLPCEDWTATA